MSDTHSRFNGPTRCFAAILIPIFAFQFVCPPAVRAETATAASVLGLPVPGAMVGRSQGYTPALIKGIRPDPENPLQMNFIIESGDSRIEGEAFNQEARKLIKYFLTALTVPPKELWVNLSPVEKDRLIPEGLGETEMGRDMLAQDYLLKQLTASLMYPEEELGKGFWDRVYAKAKILYGTTNIPISTFNKVWIVPDAAGVYEYQGSAYVIRSHLKVMLEEDYQALQANRDNAMLGMDRVADDDAKVVNRVSSDVVREVLIPEIEKEINEGKTFANLRQIYDAMILATWYKQALKESLLATVYADQNKTKGVDVEDKEIKRKIYAQYLAAFEKGVYNYIKRDTDEETKKVTSRRYFSGGVDGKRLPEEVARDSVKGKKGASSDLSAEDRVRLPGEGAKEVKSVLVDLGPGSAQTLKVEAAVAASSVVGLPEGRWEHWADIITGVDLQDFFHRVRDMFGDYDYRSIGPILKPEIVFLMGLVWADMAIKEAENAGITDRTVLLARDGRKIEHELVDALVAALRYRGLDVVYIAAEGPNSVTSYSWAIQQFNPLMSIFMTASHVSKPENIIVRGFKVAILREKDGNIQSLSTREIKSESFAALKDLVEHPHRVKEKEAQQKGTFTPRDITENVVRFNTLLGRVVAADGSLLELGESLKRAGKENKNPFEIISQYEQQFAGVIEPLKGMKIVIEGSHTQSGPLAADTFRRLGAEVILLHGDIQEISGEHKADPSISANLVDLEEAIKKENADFGIAFDLDGDRGAIHVPVRSPASSEVKFVGVAPDNAIVTLLPLLMSKWGYKQTGVKVGVIRDVLGTHGVNDVAEREGAEFFQTDAGYVFLKAVKREQEKNGYVFPMYGERSGHTWLHVTGEIENPLAVAVLFATVVKNRQQDFFQDRVAGVQQKVEILNPVLDVYNGTTIPYLQSPRSMPFFHPDLLQRLSADTRNTTGWEYNPKTPTNPPKAIIALGKDIGIRRLQQEFTPGKTYDTPVGTLAVKEFNTYQDGAEEGGLFRYADIVFSLNGQFVGHFIFRASSNDPAFVISYEAPILEGRSPAQTEPVRQTIAGLVLDFLTSQKIVAEITLKGMEDVMPQASGAQRLTAFEKANLPFVQEDFNAFLKARGISPVVSQRIAGREISDIPDREEASPIIPASTFLPLEAQLSEVARILSVQAGVSVPAIDSKIREAFSRSVDLKKILNDFAESVGISAVQALKNMIAAGLAVQNPGQVGLNYSLTPDFFGQDTLERFRQIQIQSSQNPEMVDLALLRLERILLSAVNVDDFFAQLADGQRPADIVAALESQGLLSTLTAAWNRSQVEHQLEVRRKPLSAGDLVNPQTPAYYQSRGIDVDFSIPQQAAVGENQLAVLSAYQRVFAAEMARGEFNYRGTGTRQTVEQYFQESFMQRDYNRIRDFVRSLFPEGLDAIVTNGIGANDQFMWALVEMYNQNRGAGDPVWHHVITARDLVKLEGLNPGRTLGIHISRSGSTWEGVEVASRLVAKGFNKMIVLANGGDLKAIADTVNKEKPGTAITIGMQPDIGGRNMHRKTPIYYTAQTVAGMFVPQMDAPVFARLHHEFDQHNDFGNEQGLALNAARFLHGLMELRGVNHIAFMSNTTQTALMGSELSQYMMEGANKEHIISWGDHELGSEPADVLENLTRGPAGQKVVGLAILDKASQHFERERARVEALKERIALITFVIDSRKQTADQLAGVRPEQQAAFDILWTDFITALTTFLRVDANSNPNVKVVRAMTADYVAKWRDISARYTTDAIGSGKTKVLVSLGYPGKPEIGTPEKQIPLTPENIRDLARSLVQELDRNGMLTNRDRLNVFSGTENLVEVMKALRNGSYQTPLSTLLGWIFETGLYPGRAHKAHEATLAFSTDPARRLLANQSINFFLNQRSLGENPAFNEPFVDTTGTGKYINVNGATLHQTNDSMTFPNIQRTAQVSPTVLLEFQTLTPEVKGLLETFYQAFLDELAKIPPTGSSLGINDPSKGPAGEDEVPADAAQATTATDSFAGINLDPALLDLQIKRDGNGVPFPLPQQPVESMRIEGFIPIIINVTPVPNLPLLLGLTAPDEESPQKKAPGSAQKPGPADIRTVRTGRES